MNKFNPKKLLNSKWTAVTAINKEKHFLVTELQLNDEGDVIGCLIEAVISNKTTQLHWRDLMDINQWLQGWK